MADENTKQLSKKTGYLILAGGIAMGIVIGYFIGYRSGKIDWKGWN